MSPIECEQVLQQIELYLDGELEVAARLEIRQHLIGCSPCTDRSEFQRRLKELMRAKCGCHDMPLDLLTRIRALLEEEPGPLRA